MRYLILSSIIFVGLNAHATPQFNRDGTISRLMQIDFSRALLMDPEDEDDDTLKQVRAIARDFAQLKVAAPEKLTVSGVGSTVNPMIGHAKYKNFFRFNLKGRKQTFTCQAVADEGYQNYSAGCYQVFP